MHQLLKNCFGALAAVLLSSHAASAELIVWDSNTLSDPNGSSQSYNNVLGGGSSPWTFVDVDGSGVDVKLTPGGTLSANHAIGGGAIHAYENNNAGDPGPQIYTTNPDAVYDTNAIRWTNGYDFASADQPTTDQGSGFTLDFSEDVYLREFIIGSISRIGGRLEGVVVEAYDGAGLTGNRIAAFTITEEIYVASGSAPVDGNYSDITNINSSYQIISDPDVLQGSGGTGQYGRVNFDFGVVNTIRSIAVSQFAVSNSTGNWVAPGSNPTSMFIAGDLEFVLATPEPSGIAMSILGALALGCRRRRRRRQTSSGPVSRTNS